MSYNKSQLQEMTAVCKHTAASSLKDAEVLAANSSYARAGFLLFLGLEETIKYSMFNGALLSGSKEINWKIFNKIIVSHETKIEFFIYARNIHEATQSSIKGILSNTAQDLDNDLKFLHKCREMTLYPEIMQGKVISPDRFMTDNMFNLLNEYIKPCLDWLLSEEKHRESPHKFWETMQNFCDFNNGNTAMYYFSERAKFTAKDT